MYTQSRFVVCLSDQHTYLKPFYSHPDMHTQSCFVVCPSGPQSFLHTIWILKAHRTSTAYQLKTKLLVCNTPNFNNLTLTYKYNVFVFRLRFTWGLDCTQGTAPCYVIFRIVIFSWKFYMCHPYWTRYSEAKDMWHKERESNSEYNPKSIL